MRKLFGIIATLVLATLPLPAQNTNTQTFTDLSYVSLSCYTDPASGQLRFQNGEFHFKFQDANGNWQFATFDVYAPSNLNQETPEMSVTVAGQRYFYFTKGTWDANPPQYSFAVGTLPSATIDFTISKSRTAGCIASNVTATLTQ